MKLTYVLPEPDFFSEFGQGGQVTHAKGIVKGLVENGVDVTIVSEKNIKKYVDKTFEKVTCKIVDKPKIGFLLRKIAFAYKCFKKIESSADDYLLVRKNIGVLILCLLTLNLKLVTSKKEIFWEVNGLTFEGLRNHKIGKPLYLFVLFVHKILLRKSTGIYVVSDSLKKELTNGIAGIESNKIVVIPNGGPDWLGPKKEINSDSVRFIFFGVFQPYNDFEFIVETFRSAKKELNSQIELHFCGYGNRQDFIEKCSSEDSDIYYWGSKRPPDLHYEGIATSKSVGLIPLKDIGTSQFLSPIKLFDYIALGMPVIISDAVRLKDELDVDEITFIYEPNNTESLKGVMMQFIHQDKANWKELSRCAKKTTSKNNWTYRMKRLIDFIKSKY